MGPIGTQFNLIVTSGEEELARKACELFARDAKQAIEEKGICYAAISGGRTPAGFFHELGEQQISRALDWEQIHLFWVDERCVDIESSESNYGLAEKTFIRKVGIPERNVHRIQGELNDPREGAVLYESELRQVFNLKKPGNLPRFDIIVLGMGNDGHTGSLFPDSYANFDNSDLVSAVYMKGDMLNRITLTHPVLCAAHHVVVLVSGRDKAATLKAVLTEEPDQVKFPIHRLWTIRERVTWLVDADAASQL